MDELELLNGVYTAAYDTFGGKQNVENRDNRLKLITKRSNCYEEWELFCIENDQAVRCICGMPASIGRSAILKSTIDELFIYVGSNSWTIRRSPLQIKTTNYRIQQPQNRHLMRRYNQKYLALTEQ